MLQGPRVRAARISLFFLVVVARRPSRTSRLPFPSHLVSERLGELCRAGRSVYHAACHRPSEEARLGVARHAAAACRVPGRTVRARGARRLTRGLLGRILVTVADERGADRAALQPARPAVLERACRAAGRAAVSCRDVYVAWHAEMIPLNVRVVQSRLVDRRGHVVCPVHAEAVTCQMTLPASTDAPLPAASHWSLQRPPQALPE